MTKALLFCVCIVIASHVFAQEVTRGPVTATMRFVWEAPDNITNVTDAQTFEWRLKDGAVPATALTNVTCTISNAVLTCQSPLGQSQADALNIVGVHALTLTAFRADVGESQASDPFTLTSPVGAPTSLRIIR